MPRKPVQSFIRWSSQMNLLKPKKKDKKNEQSTSQRGTEVWYDDQQGKTDRNDQKIISNDVLYLAEL